MSNLKSTVAKAKPTKPSKEEEKRIKEEARAYSLSINKINNLTKYTADPTLRAILTQSKTYVGLRVEPDGAHVRIMDSRTNEAVGNLGDLERLQGFRNFVTMVKKQSNHNTALEPVRTIAFNAFKKLKNADGSFEPTLFTPGAIQSLKAIDAETDNLMENSEFLDSLFRTCSTDYEKNLLIILKLWTQSIVGEIVALVDRIVSGQETKGFMTDALFNAGVPKWAYDKLAKTELAMLQQTDVRYIFFPRADFRKGITYTVREIASAAFRGKVQNTYLLRGSQFAVAVISTPSILKVVGGAETDVSLDSETDKVGLELRNEKVCISPPEWSEDTFVDPRITKPLMFCGNPSLLSARESLKTVLDFGLGFQTMDLKTVDPVGNVLAGAFPQPTQNLKEISKAKRGNLVAVAKGEPDFEAVLESYFNFEAGKRDHFKDLITTVIGIKPTHALTVEILRAFDILNTAKTAAVAAAAVPDAAPLPTPINPGEDVFKQAWLGYSTTPETQAAKEEWKDFLESVRLDPDYLEPKKAASKATKYLALIKSSKELVAQIRADEKIGFLAEHISTWLGGFSVAQYQQVGASFVAAQFDQLAYIGEFTDGTVRGRAPEPGDNDDDF